MTSIVEHTRITKYLNSMAPFINQALEVELDLAHHSLLSITLVKTLPCRSKLIGYILMKTLIRFGDLHKLDLASIGMLERFSIIQSKNQKQISGKFNIHSADLRYKITHFEDFESILEYDRYANDVKRFCKKIKFFNEIRFKHHAHFFRHMEASYLLSLGMPVSHIALRLGDLESTVKSHYLHESLNNLFS